MNSFRFTAQAIDTPAARRDLEDGACGGYASFEGWVRHNNEGHDVARLEYEAFAELAIKEGERILQAANDKFMFAPLA
mgnify:CR=1 FL=1